MAADKNAQSDNDADIFRKAMSGTRRIKDDERHYSKATRKPPRPRMKEADELAVMDALLDPTPEWLDDFDSLTGEELSYRYEGVQLSTMRKLRRGQYVIEEELDLHGCTVATAKSALVEFLAYCAEQDHRCVRIIHGKGNRSGNKGPVLKARVDYWLRQRNDVMAFCSAPMNDGGSGALYVLLRRQKTA